MNRYRIFRTRILVKWEWLALKPFLVLTEQDHRISNQSLATSIDWTQGITWALRCFFIICFFIGWHLPQIKKKKKNIKKPDSILIAKSIFSTSPRTDWYTVRSNTQTWITVFQYIIKILISYVVFRTWSSCCIGNSAFHFNQSACFMQKVVWQEREKEGGRSSTQLIVSVFTCIALGRLSAESDSKYLRKAIHVITLI